MRAVLLVMFLALMMVYSSGCATILGGIIGHQSGEAGAGMIIGAAVDFGGGIIMGIGEMLGGKKVNVYSEQGYIRVNRDLAKRKNLTHQLQKRFEQLNWQFGESEDVSTGKKITISTYNCRTAEEKEFTLEFISEKGQDLRIYVKPVQQNKEFKILITTQIGTWITEIIS